MKRAILEKHKDDLKQQQQHQKLQHQQELPVLSQPSPYAGPQQNNYEEDDFSLDPLSEDEYEQPMPGQEAFPPLQPPLNASIYSCTHPSYFNPPTASNSHVNGPFYSEYEVKHSPRAAQYFIAGRGGETNHHVGNHQIRTLILSKLPEYQAAPNRGKRYCRQLLQREPRLWPLKFVVRKSYFDKHCQVQPGVRVPGQLSADRVASVQMWHSQETLRVLPDHVYLSIGPHWTVGIVQDLLRGGVATWSKQQSPVATGTAARTPDSNEQLPLSLPPVPQSSAPISVAAPVASPPFQLATALNRANYDGESSATSAAATITMLRAAPAMSNRKSGDF